MTMPSQQHHLSPEDLNLIVRSLANWATSGRPIDSYALTTEIDIVFGLISVTRSDPPTVDGVGISLYKSPSVARKTMGG
jgi:hypothetical protein